MIRDGYVVTFDGQEWDAAPDGDDVRIYSTQAADGFEEIRPGRFVRVLKPPEIQDLAYVRTTCTWRGQPFIVLAETGAWLRLEYTGGRAPVARQLGLEEYDYGVYQGWAPAEEVTELYEHKV